MHLGPNGGNQLPKTYHNNGRNPGKDFVGGGENLRSKDFLNLYHDAENLLACMVLDGIFEKFPELRCGLIELGAGWVPNLLRSLDNSVRAFGRHEPELSKLTMPPSDYIRRQVRFTPWAFRRRGLAGVELWAGAVLVLVRLAAPRRRPRPHRGVPGIVHRCRPRRGHHSPVLGGQRLVPARRLRLRLRARQRPHQRLVPARRLRLHRSTSCGPSGT